MSPILSRFESVNNNHSGYTMPLGIHCSIYSPICAVSVPGPPSWIVDSTCYMSPWAPFMYDLCLEVFKLSRSPTGICHLDDMREWDHSVHGMLLHKQFVYCLKKSKSNINQIVSHPFIRSKKDAVVPRTWPALTTKTPKFEYGFTMWGDTVTRPYLTYCETLQKYLSLTISHYKKAISYQYMDPVVNLKL